MPAFRCPVRLLAIGSAFACLVAAGQADAIAIATKPAASGAAARSASSPGPTASRPVPRAFATRDQLRTCMSDEDTMRERHRKLDAAHVRHQRAIADLQEENAKIVEVQGQLDAESQTAVGAFNLLVAQHNVRTDELNKEAGEMSAQSQAFNADSLALSQRCSGLAYRLEDMDAVMKERKAGSK
jgi:hypothetical protein